MAGSRTRTKRKTRRLLYLIPLIALAAVVGAYVLAYDFPSAPAAMDYTWSVSVQNWTATSSYVYLIPPAIGELAAGASWQDHTFDTYGLDNRSPLYADTPPNPYPGYSVIHVRSKINYNFTLGDFFNVWGQPLGNFTMNIAPKGSFHWEMCNAVSSKQIVPVSQPWGPYRLSPNLKILLVYSVQGCGTTPAP